MNCKNDKMCNIFENDPNYVISGGSEDDRNSGDAGNEEQVGDLGNEVLYGGNRDDTLAGDSVNDILHGEGGINTLRVARAKIDSTVDLTATESLTLLLERTTNLVIA